MPHILIIGAGRSSGYLIDYLAKAVQTYTWDLSVADVSLNVVEEKIKAYPWVKAVALNILDKESTSVLVKKADVVVSLLPVFLQSNIAKYCLEFNSHLLTASYLPEEIKQMDKETHSKKLLFLNEMGLDPGIDHMSAMQIIDKLKKQEAEIKGFMSFAGGLIAPESDNNPWNYKFTWNPRNVVLAGQGGTAKFMEKGHFKYVNYQQLFKQTRKIHIDNYGEFEAYPNRDSLSYQTIYGLHHTETLLRGTLRKAGFCRAWDIFVQLGLTDNSFALENCENMAYKEFLDAFLPEDNSKNTRQKLAIQLKMNEKDEILDKLEWLGLFSDAKISLSKASPAEILQNLLEEKWKLADSDRDMIVMQHQFKYVLKGQNQQLISDMVLIGEDAHKTAMAKTVGLPLAIATKLLLRDKIQLRGVQIPIHKEIYAPVLDELKTYGIIFQEKIL